MCVKHYVEHQRAMIRENINLAESLVEVLGEDRIRQIGRSRESSGFKTPVGTLEIMRFLAADLDLLFTDVDCGLRVFVGCKFITSMEVESWWASS